MFRINKTKNYTVISNYHLQDRNLSYKCLLSYMLSLSSDWDYSIKGLVTLSKENIIFSSDFEFDTLEKVPTILYCCIFDESKIY